MDKEKIINTVCEVCEVSPADILSYLRTRDMSDARTIIAFVRVDSGECFSVPEAASVVGLKRNSAYVALNHFNDLLRINAPFRFRYNAVLKKLSTSD
jgi:hypothetical protein